MEVSVIFWSACVFVLVFGSSSGSKDVSKSKKLKNVIITSFGELPYEPMETGGFYQSDVIPVNFQDEIQQQTMDVALRTGILVEDPNEKKTPDDTEDVSAENDAAQTTTNQHVKDSEDLTVGRAVKEFNGPLHSPRFNSNGFRHPRDSKTSRHSSDQVQESRYPRSFGHERRQARRQNQRHPTTDLNGYNIHQEYDGDLGEGWNLQDAEDILQGRNYNLLAHSPNINPQSYPIPPPKEIPPPMFYSGARHPTYFPLPGVRYSPLPQHGFLVHPKPVRRSPDDVVYGRPTSKSQTQGSISYNAQQPAESQYSSRQVIPYNQPLRINYHYLSGI
ncbi:hypothetical protein J6590_075510 [Homalodisca vitripennis]|nr:hypothetical protein J6590_075510 [Homalodisca vitripennis]